MVDFTFWFEMGLLVLCCLGLVAFIAYLDAIRNGLHVPYDDAQWPEGHHLYKYERRHWRAKRGN